jgi:hypothetical protein
LQYGRYNYNLFYLLLWQTMVSDQQFSLNGVIRKSGWQNTTFRVGFTFYLPTYFLASNSPVILTGLLKTEKILVQSTIKFLYVIYVLVC